MSSSLPRNKTSVEIRRPTLYGAANNILGRWLHFGIALSLVLCLLLALVMDSRGHQISGATIAFTLHKFIGLNALLFISLYFLWTANGYTKKAKHLFPWFSRSQKRLLREELRLGISYFKEWQAIPAAIQGLGLLMALVANLSGLLLVLHIIFPTLMGMGLAQAVISFHITTSHLIWAYLAVHVTAFLMHMAVGNRIYLKMFKLLTPDVSQLPRGKVIPADSRFKKFHVKAVDLNPVDPTPTPPVPQRPPNAPQF